MKNFFKLMIASMILSSTGFARTGETGTGIGGGDPAHLIQSEEPKKEIPHLEMRHCLAMTSTMFPAAKDNDPFVASISASPEEGIISILMSTNGYVKMHAKSPQDFIRGYTIRNFDDQPVFKEPGLIKLMKDKGIKKAVKNFEEQKALIISGLKEKTQKTNFAPGSQYLSISEFKHIKDSFCDCEKLKVKSIIEASNKAKEAIINNEDIKVLEPKSEPRVLKPNDLACEFTGA